MTQAQADEIIALLRAATGGRVQESTASYFSAALRDMDYEIALSSATTGATVWRFFPSWAEFKEIYSTQKKLLEPVGEQRTDLPSRSKYGDAAPEWVWVWSWARQKRAPRCLIPFPQQNVPDIEASLSMEEYEALREEWTAAGKPKAEKLLPMSSGKTV